MKKFAILGQGQLATMLIESADNLALEVKAFPLPAISQNGLTEQAEIARYCHQLKHFDVVSFEIENIAVELLTAIQAMQSVSVYPSIQALAVAQDRLNEKNTFNYLNIPTNNFFEINNYQDLRDAASELRYPFVLKTRRFGYDGKGQMLVKNSMEQEIAWKRLSNHPLIAEQWVDFDYEVSQIASRDHQGNISYYPLVRNEHRSGILRETHVIAIDKPLSDQAQNISAKLLTYFNYVGTFTIEFFVKGNNLYANEIAPRVHNSGHWSIDGATTSQFENHMRAIAGLGVKPASISKAHAIMINLIAEDVPATLITNNYIKPKSYGKTWREGRKMGHINIVADNKQDFLKAYNEVYSSIDAKPCWSYIA